MHTTAHRDSIWHQFPSEDEENVARNFRFMVVSSPAHVLGRLSAVVAPAGMRIPPCGAEEALVTEHRNATGNGCVGDVRRKQRVASWRDTGRGSFHQ